MSLDVFAEDRGLQGLFNSVVLMRSDHAALCGHISDPSEGDEELSYMELQIHCDAIESQLRLRYNIRRGDAVVLCCKGYAAAELVGCVACSRMCAPFVPVDADWIHTTSRLKEMFADCVPAAAICVAESDTDDVVQALAVAGMHKTVLLQPNGAIVSDHSWATLLTRNILQPSESSTDFTGDTDTDPPLYIMYTSGSTGISKGVRGTYNGLLNRVRWQGKRYGWEQGDVVCRRTPLIFVDAMAEIFGSLLSGSSLWAPPRYLLASSGISSIALHASVAGVTHITLLPSQLSLMLRQLPEVVMQEKEERGMTWSWSTLRLVFVSGETCEESVVIAFREAVLSGVLPCAQLINLYGATEVAGDVCAADLYTRKSSTLDIGMGMTFVPIATEVINGNLLFVAHKVESKAVTTWQLVKPGEEGELLVGGIQVADGYQTPYEDLRFIPSPFPECTGKIFCTGDIVRVHKTDGSLPQYPLPVTGICLELLGRKDFQVKLSGGARAHLQEVEITLTAAMRKSAVHDVDPLVVLTCLRQESGGDVLVAFIDRAILPTIGLNSTALSLHENELNISVAVRALLVSRNFPTIYLPEFTFVVDVIPRTTTGKVNRKMLQRHAERLVAYSRSKGRNITNIGHVKDLMQSRCDLPQTLLDIIESILCIFGTVLSVDPLQILSSLQEEDILCSPSASLTALGGDSMKGFEVVWLISQKHGVRVDHKHVMKLSLYHLAKAIEEGASPCVTAFTRIADDDVNHDTIFSDHCDAGVGRGVKRKRDSQKVIVEQGKPDVVWWSRACMSSKDAQEPLNNDVLGNTFCGMREVWSCSLNRCIDSSPLVAFSRVTKSRVISFVGSHGGDFAAIDGTGQLVWATNLGKDVHIEGGAICDPHCSLAVMDSSVSSSSEQGYPVFVSSYFGRDVDGAQRNEVSDRPEDAGVRISYGMLWCLDSRSGEVLWCSGDSITGEIKACPSIIRLPNPVSDNFTSAVLVGSYDGSIYCFRSIDGTLLDRIETGCGAIYTSIIFVGSPLQNNTTSGSIRDFIECCVCTTSGWVVSLSLRLGGRDSHESSQHLEYHFNWKHRSLNSAPVFSTPVSTSITIPSTLRSTPDDCPQNKLCVIYATVGGNITCLSCEDGSVVWVTQLLSPKLQTCPVFSPLCLLHYPDETCVILGAHDGYVRCIACRSGYVQWEVDVGAVVFGAPFVYYTHRHCITKLYIIVCTTAGDVCLIEECSKGEHNPALEWKISQKLRLPGEVFSSPVVCSHSDCGRIWVGCRDNSLHCIAFD